MENTPQNVGLRSAYDLVRKNYQDRLSVKATNLAAVIPFEACLLDQGRPFIDREPFRDHLKDINNEAGRRFMVVNGPSGVGKSYSYYLIQSLAPQCGFKLSYVELKDGKRAGFHAIDLAKKIKRDLFPMDPGKILDQQASVDARWAGELTDWLVEAVKSSGMVCWIVLDGFGCSELPEDTQVMLAGLVDAVDKTLSNVRLILIDYDKEKLPVSVRYFAHEDNLMEVSQADLESFLSRLCEYKNIRPNRVKVRAAAAALLANLPEKPEEHMLAIMFRILQAVPNLPVLGKKSQPARRARRDPAPEPGGVGN